MEGQFYHGAVYALGIENRGILVLIVSATNLIIGLDFEITGPALIFYMLNLYIVRRTVSNILKYITITFDLLLITYKYQFSAVL